MRWQRSSPLVALFATCAIAFPRSEHSIVARQQNASGLAFDLKSIMSSDASVYAQGSADFELEGLRYTNFHRPTFTISVVPTIEEDVSAVIKYAVAHDIPFFIAGAGHGYSSTLSIVQNAIQISLKHFNTANVDANGTLTIGGATTFGTLINATYAAGRELTTGSAVCVGAVGATLGGGHGPFQGKYGLALDALISLRVVLANGSIITTSPSENTDLWYAMRGAGASFGAVIAATYKTWPQSNKGQILDVEWTFAEDKTEQIFALANSIAPNISENLGLFVSIGVSPTNKPIISVVLEWTGPEKDALPYLTQIRELDPIAESYASYAWNVLGYRIAGGAFAPGGPGCAKNKTRITYGANLARFDLPTIRSLINNVGDFASQYPASNNVQIGFEIFGQAAQLAIPDSASAYANRKFDNIIHTITVTPVDLSLSGVADEWIRKQRDMLFSTAGYEKNHVYQNYAHGDEGLGAIYGYDPARLSKLQRIKAKYDPRNVFNGYHDVPLPDSSS